MTFRAHRRCTVRTWAKIGSRLRLRISSDLIFVLYKIHTFSVKLLLDLGQFLLNFSFLSTNVWSKLATKFVKSLDFPSKLSSDNRWSLNCVLAASFDVRPHSQNHVNNVVEVAIRGSQHSSCGHDKLLHRFKEVEMQVLVATSGETANLISKAEECNPFIASKFTLIEHSCDWLFSFSHKVDLLVSNFQRCHGHVPELNLLV